MLYKKIAIFLSLFAIIFCSIKGYGQHPAWRLAFGVSGTGNGAGVDMSLDKSGNIYVTGVFDGTMSFDTITLASTGGTDVYIAKFNSTGQVIWARRAGGINNEEWTSLAVDSMGNVYVTGTYSGTASFTSQTISSVGLSDIFLAKYDSAGSLVWVNSFGSPYKDIASRIIVDRSGYLYTTGLYGLSITSMAMHGTINFGSFPLTSPGDAAMYLAKLDFDGNVFWAKSAGFPRQNGGAIAGIGLASDRSANIYVTGSFDSPRIDFDTLKLYTGQGSLHDVFVAKYDSSGHIKWAKQAGGTQTEVIESDAVTTDTSGNVYITGSYYSNSLVGTISFTGVVLPADFGSYSLYVAKYSTDGTILWAKRGVGKCDDILGTSITTDQSANVYVTGGANGAIFGQDTIPCEASIFITKFDKAGQIQWVADAGGHQGSGIAYSIQKDREENLYISGNLNGMCEFGSSHMVLNNPIGLFIAKLSHDAASNVKTQTATSQVFTPFPNPSNKYVQLQFSRAVHGHVLLINSFGQIISSREIQKDTNTLSLSVAELPAGVYYVQLKGVDFNQTATISVEP